MKTYDYLQYNISELFRSLVATVSDNLSTEPSLNISGVYFKSETWVELCKRLSADDQSELHKNTKYPLVALIGNDEYDIKDDSQYPEVSLTLIIVTQSEATRLSEDRIAINYKPILYPIYTELMEVIAESAFFQGPYNPYPSHKWIENYNLGESSASGNRSIKLPDVCDGIIVTNLKLRLNRKRIAGFNYGLAKTLVYLNNVSGIACQVTGNKISVTLNAAQYVDTLSVGHPSYSVYFSHYGDSETPISIGGTRQSIGAELDGEYYGYVKCDDGVTVSRLYFHYSVYSGVITKHLESNIFILSSFAATSVLSPNVNFEIETEAISSKANIMSREYTMDGGNVFFSEPFAPAIQSTSDLVSIHNQLITPGYQDIGYNILVDGPANTSTQLESISYYKIS